MGASGGFAGITGLVVRDLRPRLPLSKRQVDWGDQGPHISELARPGHGRGPWPHSHPGQACPALQHPGCPRDSHTLWVDPPRGFQEAGGSNSFRSSGASPEPSAASGSGRGRGLPGHLGGSRSAHTSRMVTGHRTPSPQLHRQAPAVSQAEAVRPETPGARRRGPQVGAGGAVGGPWLAGQSRGPGTRCYREGGGGVRVGWGAC